MSLTRPAAAVLEVVCAAVAGAAAIAALTAGNRTTLLFPDLLLATLLALAAAVLLITGRIWPGLVAAGATALLLAWLPTSAHWTETAIEQAAGPCPPFTICKLQPPLSTDERASLVWLTTLSLGALAPAVLAAVSGILCLPETSCRPQWPALTAFVVAAPLAGLAALAPWLAGGPPFGFDDRVAFFTVFAGIAALAALFAATASARGRPQLSALLGAAAFCLLAFTVAGLPLTDWLISVFGQPQPCEGFDCPPAFTDVESRARLLMLVPAAAAAVAAGVGAAVDARYRLGMVARDQRVQHPV